LLRVGNVITLNIGKTLIVWFSTLSPQANASTKHELCQRQILVCWVKTTI